ncbi:MAG: hypothetical protein H0X17_09170, partial [Deltaproteobacteria bacterium]|nr:hypothetical protein [Deltaproteobacteria bacterium]
MKTRSFTLVTVVSLVAVAAACGDTTSNPPLQLNLDRPVDIAFACYGGLRITSGVGATADQEVQIGTAQPVAACEFRSGARAVGDPVPVPPGQEDLTAQGGDPVPNASWFGLILQSGPGTVAIAQWATKPSTAFGGGDVVVLDADPLTPGKNSISVGEDPIAIVTDASGCMAVTANAGSCDLSVLDINSALDITTGIDVHRLAVTTAAGVPLRAKPAAMVVEPNTDVIGNACPIGGPTAARPGEPSATGIAYIAYPSCHLVAGVDLASGRIVTGVQYDALGVPQIVDGNVTCPDECGVGTPTTQGTRPVALDLELDPRTQDRRLVIGSDNSASITLVELDLGFRPSSLAQLALENPEGDLGVTALAMSPVIGMGGESGMVDDENAVGGDFQFVYAIANDRTVRVVDILNVRSECDTQVDPRFLRASFSAADLGCLAVGNAATPPRRAGARGPGIELG